MRTEISKKITMEFCRRSPAGAIAFAFSAIPLLFFPLINEEPLKYFYLTIVALVIPINIARVFIARKIISSEHEISEPMIIAHSLTIFLNAICFGIFISMVLWTSPITTLGFVVSLIILAAISAGSTSSLVLKPFIQYTFLTLVALIPILELFILSIYRRNEGYGLLAFLLSIFMGYLIAHSRQYYKKMTQLYHYDAQLLDEKNQLQVLLEDLKSAQAEVNTQKARADHASRLAAIGEMASGIAHEINNPLSIIQGYVKQLQTIPEINLMKESDKIQYLERTEKIQNAVTRIGRIINGLKLFSHQKKDIGFELVDFQKIVDNTLELCAERFYLNAINLYVEQAPKNLVKVNIAQITQVLHHLLNNAFEAVIGATNPEVRVSIKIIGKYLHVYIQDNGVGITDQIKERIFIPFYTTKEVGKGAGLGLSISKGIIENHGGNIQLEENSDSKWTTFVFTLPLV